VLILKKTHIDAHALLRALERSNKFNLDYFECKERIFEVINSRKPAKKHKSKYNQTYHK